MEKINRWLQNIPALLSSKTSIFIYLFLLFYLVIFPTVCAIIRWLRKMMPSDMIQLILGNYTNVVSALGASLAAGTGVAVHQGIRRIHQRHDHLEKTIDQLHEKLEQITARDSSKAKG